MMSIKKIAYTLSKSLILNWNLKIKFIKMTNIFQNYMKIIISKTCLRIKKVSMQ